MGSPVPSHMHAEDIQVLGKLVGVNCPNYAGELCNLGGVMTGEFGKNKTRLA